MFNPGDVFRNPGNMGHMWVVVGVAPDDMRLMGNWSSKKSSRPVTCLLVPADHPTITHDSWFVYGKMQEFSETDIRSFLAQGNLIPAGQVNHTTLQKIQAGLFTDKKVSPRIRCRYAHLKS
ncbi:MAG: hypothetical protein IJE66_04965 [Akkermansia sp.]|nr:hypothetical protein [Akkermansia sp.]